MRETRKITVQIQASTHREHDFGALGLPREAFYLSVAPKYVPPGVHTGSDVIFAYALVTVTGTHRYLYRADSEKDHTTRERWCVAI